jgi:transposase
MGVRSDHQAGRSYSPKGRTPTTSGTGKRFGANVLSAITNRGHLAFMVFKARFTTVVFLRFLRRLVRQSERKAFLVVDGHPVHKSAGTRRWLAANAKKIEMFFLPGYSPDLNPDEMLNQDVKANAVRKRRPRSQPQMMRTVRSYLGRRRRDPDQVMRYFDEESVRYAAA